MTILLDFGNWSTKVTFKIVYHYNFVKKNYLKFYSILFGVLGDGWLWKWYNCLLFLLQIQSWRQDRRDNGQEGCWTGGMLDRRDAGQEGCQTGGIRVRRDEG